MSTLDASGPNAEQIKYWNELAGPRWVLLHEQTDVLLAALGLQAMDRADLSAGERVLDVGCGCGHTTFELARRVGPSGAVVGVDISTVMLERARQLARAAALHTVTFENADAQTHSWSGPAFDVLYSRFGVMFFANPDAAFVNLRAALRPGGRVAFICWRSLQENPWLLLPMMAAAQHIQLPVPAAADAPGPFAFADPDRVRGILSRAGFTDVALAPLDETLGLAGGGGVDRAVEFVLQLGPTAAALRDAGPPVRAAVAAAVRAALEPHDTPQGVRLPSAAWIVTARCP